MVLTKLEFPQPQQIEGCWEYDKSHAPVRLAPLAGDAVVMTMGEGFTIAQHEFGSVLELKCRMINNYFYAAFRPDESFKPTTTDIDQYSKELDRIAAGIGERWINEWQPSLMPILERARTVDSGAMSHQHL